MKPKYNRHWERFPAHTRLKHGILQGYLGAWARILLQQGRHTRIWFVDAFAGRGADEKGNPGSPLIACQIARDVHSELATRGRAPTGQLRIVAVEEDPNNFEAIRAAMDSYLQDHSQPLLLQGPIGTHYKHILDQTGNEPALFFLDPYGLDGLSALMIAEMLSGDRHEVLILFSEESTHRLSGAVKSDPNSSSPMSANLPLFEDIAAPAQKARSMSYREADESILQEVYAGLWHLADQAAELSPGKERESYLDSYCAIQELLGATHVVPMSITDERDRHQYSLVHASKSGKAAVVMKDALNSALNKRVKEFGLLDFHVASPGLTDLSDRIVAHFAGQTVRWQDKKARDTVKGYALEETWALVSDLPDIKKILIETGHVSGKWPLTFRFPKNL